MQIRDLRSVCRRNNAEGMLFCVLETGLIRVIEEKFLKVSYEIIEKRLDRFRKAEVPSILSCQGAYK